MYVANLLNNLKEFIKNSRYVVCGVALFCDVRLRVCEQRAACRIGGGKRYR